jgi:hypothetical protein
MWSCASAVGTATNRTTRTAAAACSSPSSAAARCARAADRPHRRRALPPGGAAAPPTPPGPGRFMTGDPDLRHSPTPLGGSVSVLGDLRGDGPGDGFEARLWDTLVQTRPRLISRAEKAGLVPPSHTANPGMPWPRRARRPAGRGRGRTTRRQGRPRPRHSRRPPRGGGRSCRCGRCGPRRPPRWRRPAVRSPPPVSALPAALLSRTLSG